MTLLEEEVWPDFGDLSLLLEPYGIDIKDVTADGLRIIPNPNRRPVDPSLALEITTFDRDPVGLTQMRGSRVATSKTTIPMSLLPGLTPRP